MIYAQCPLKIDVLLDYYINDDKRQQHLITFPYSAGQLMRRKAHSIAMSKHIIQKKKATSPELTRWWRMMCWWWTSPQPNQPYYRIGCRPNREKWGALWRLQHATWPNKSQQQQRLFIKDAYLTAGTCLTNGTQWRSIYTHSSLKQQHLSSFLFYTLQKSCLSIVRL